MLVKGSTPFKGVRLIESNSRKAIIEINGARRTLLVGQFAKGSIKPAQKSVTVNRNNNGQYIADGKINQKKARMLVDTGANVMALNSSEAQRLGIPYKKGKVVQVGTASQTTQAYLVTLPSVTVGNITAKNIAATVHDGTHPPVILLGVSFLKHVKLSENNGVMVLESKH